MLIEHGVDDVNEGFVAGEKSMASGQQVAFQPALALMFAEHFHHPSIRGDVIIELVSSPTEQRLVISNTAFQRFDGRPHPGRIHGNFTG